MKVMRFAAVTVALIPALATAQTVQTASVPAPVPVVMPTAPVTAVQTTELPANTEILLSMNTEISSTTHRAGETFTLSTATDTRIGDTVVIPRGTRAVGEVLWRTGRGAFGKSGKMRIALRYLDYNGTRIPIEGDYFQAGEGNTLATVGGVIAVGVFAAFITGSRARIPAGRELSARTSFAVPFERSDNGARLASDFGALSDTWRTAQASDPQAVCRRQSETRAGDPERVASFIRECVRRTQTASR